MRQLEERITAAKTEGSPVDKAPKPAYILDLEERLHTLLGTKVTIREKNEKGRIMIEFYSQDDFERIFNLLESAGRR